MRHLMFVLLVALAPAGASAQSTDGAPVASVEIRKMCRAAVLKICSPGFPPSKDVLLRCAARNVDRLPADCALLLAALAPSAK